MKYFVLSSPIRIIVDVDVLVGICQSLLRQCFVLVGRYRLPGCWLSINGGLCTYLGEKMKKVIM